MFSESTFGVSVLYNTASEENLPASRVGRGARLGAFTQQRYLVTFVRSPPSNHHLTATVTIPKLLLAFQPTQVLIDGISASRDAGTAPQLPPTRSAPPALPLPSRRVHAAAPCRFLAVAVLLSRLSCCRAVPRVLGCAALRPVPGGVTHRPVPGRAALRASLGRWRPRRPGEQAAYPDRGRALLRLAISKYELHSPCNADGRENFLLF